jgi:integrase
MLTAGHAPSTSSVNSNALRRVLRWLWEEHGTPKLDGSVPHMPGPRPRNVTTNREVIDALTRTPDLALRMMVLLCSDLAIRSGTALKIAPHNHDSANQTLHFATKKGEKVSLPLTAEITELIALCNPMDPRPFVTQLQTLHPPHTGQTVRRAVLHHTAIHKRFAKLVATITPKRITFHDLRRTAAVRMYELTGDLRAVQALLGHRSMNSTIWYLDHDLMPVSRATLELIKRAPGPERKIAC